MKTTNVNFDAFAEDAMTHEMMNFIRGGFDPEDIIITPDEEEDPPSRDDGSN